MTTVFVYAGYVSPSGEVTRVDFDGGWHGVGEHGNAGLDDRHVTLARTIQVDATEEDIGLFIAPADMPRVAAAILDAAA